MEKKSLKISLKTVICIAILVVLTISISIYLLINKLSKVNDDGVNITNTNTIMNIIYN